MRFGDIMNTIVKSELAHEEKEQVLSLWNKEYPVQLSYKDTDAFDEFLLKMGKPNHKLLFEGDSLVGWVVTFNRDKERWFSIIVNSNQHGKGIGKRLLENAMREEVHQCGWVVDHNDYILSDGTPYVSPLPFYIKLGFEVIIEERYKGESLSAVKICRRK